MTPNHILLRYERCRDALPNIRAVGKLSFWLSCLYVADQPRTIRDLAAVGGMTYSQAKVHIQLMKRNQLVTVTSCSKTHPDSIFMHTANERMMTLLGFTSSPPASKGEWMQSLYHDSAHFMRDGQAACASSTNGVHSTPGTAWFKHDGNLRKCMRCMRHATASEQRREKIFDHDVEYVHADEIRRALMGHRRSELWGDNGLIAATMRCVDAIGLIEDLVTTDHETKEAFIQRVRGILGHNAKMQQPRNEA